MDLDGDRIFLTSYITNSLARIPQISFSLVFSFHTIISLVNTSFIEKVSSANGNIPRKEERKLRILLLRFSNGEKKSDMRAEKFSRHNTFTQCACVQYIHTYTLHIFTHIHIYANISISSFSVLLSHREPLLPSSRKKLWFQTRRTF